MPLTGILVNLSVIPASYDVSNSELLLKGEFNSFVSGMSDVSVVNAGTTTFKNYPALEYELDFGISLETGKLILAEKRLFSLAVNYSKEGAARGEAEINYGRFFNSLQVRQ